MSLITVLAALVLLVSQPLQEPQAPHDEHWSYSGAQGPSHWSGLSPEFAACKLGKEQSPINIEGPMQPTSQPIQSNYKPSPLEIINNGHTVQINYAPGSSITVAGKEYEVQQFHFHHPSEEKIHGRAYDMVAHIVHKDSEGQTAVVAVLLEAGAQNPFIQRLWGNLPAVAGKEESEAGMSINLADLLPTARGYYTFIGSLTTPPCTEGVRWFVMKTPVQVSAAQVAVFGKLYPNNARPTQPTHGRKIKQHP